MTIEGDPAFTDAELAQAELTGVDLDAPLDVKVAWEAGYQRRVGAGAAGDPVLFAGDAAVNAVGDRAATPGQHNWVPTGPRNVGGRVRALAIHPVTPATMFAGGASGGVHRSTDGGETWVPLWHEQASLAIGAIAISRANPQLVWVATGEIRTGGGEVIRGDGIWRSTDGGNTWSNPATPHVPGAHPNLGFHFDAVAADPTNDQFCWAVGPAGVFRTRDQGVNWHLFPNTAGAYFSDAVFSQDGNHLYLVKVGHLQDPGGVVVRIDRPRDPDAAIDGQFNEPFPTFPPDPPNLPGNFWHIPLPRAVGRGKLAIGVSNQAIGYVRFVATRPGAAPTDVHLALLRCDNLRRPTAHDEPWVQLPDHPNWPGERQGTYDLSIGVSPQNVAHVATGMFDLYVTTNGTDAAPTWTHAMAGQLYHVDRAHHEDHHAAVFDPVANPPPLWVGNDGGISVSHDWHKNPVDPHTGTLPTPPNVITWRKRSFGINAAQMYDIGQSPLVPTLYGCGFQDNGVHVTGGGHSWKLVIAADGGFVAFDPDDPYDFFTTFQGGIVHVEFPGRLEGRLPAPGIAFRLGLWARIIDQGFLPFDGALFVAPTAYHPRDNGRVLHARTGRLYGMHKDRSGEEWSVEPVGRGVELILEPAAGANAATLNVVIPPAGVSDAAPKLGLEPQGAAGNPARIMCMRPGPYALAAGDQLHLLVDGAPRTITFVAGQAIATLATATVPEVCAEINRQLDAAPPLARLRARPLIWPRPFFVEIVTDAVSTAGAAASITVAGNGLGPFLLPPGTYTGAVGHPAVVRLRLQPGNRFVDVSGVAAPNEIVVTVGGRAAKTMAFAAPPFATLTSLRAGELAHQLRTALAGEPVQVRTVNVLRGIRLSPLPGETMRFDREAAGSLGLPAGPTTDAVTLTQESFFLDAFGTDPPQRLRIRDRNHQRTIQFNAALGLNDLTQVTPVELLRVLKSTIDGNLNIRVEAFFIYGVGSVTEIEFSPSRPNRVWIGSFDGALYRSEDSGASWAQVPTSHAMTDQDRRVGAVAFHPEQPDTVYVGLQGEQKDLGNSVLGTGANDSGFLFRTTDGGTIWTHVGASIGDTLGNVHGINALATDPAEPDALYAATDIGVFRSPDRGDTWVAFNQGLPNVRVTDMVLEPTRRMLRAGGWGRSVYERHVGTQAVSDVHLYVRASDLDDGFVRPAPLGPDVFSFQPEAEPTTQSPDIKLNRVRPPQVGADELIDGVEFDEEIEHEPPVPGPTRLFVQVHNRGASVATGVRVIALWADATDGPPPLPRTFWDDLRAGQLAEDVGAWDRIHDGEIGGGPSDDRITAADPRVVSFPVDFTAAAAARRVGILVLVSSAADPHAAGEAEVDVAKLLDRDRRVAYRETDVVPAGDDARLFLIGHTGLTSTDFSIAGPAAPSALATLGLTAAVSVPSAMGGSGPFDLTVPPPAAQTVVLSLDPQDVTITFTQPDIPNLAQSFALHVGTFLNQKFFEEDVLARADLTGNFNLVATAVRINGANGAQVEVTGGSAAPLIGLAVGGGPQASITGNAQGPTGYNLAAGGPHTLTVRVTRNISLRFDPARFATPAAATAADVRRFVNAELRPLNVPIRAVVPRVDLRVRASTSDADGRRTTTGGAHLADLLVAPRTAAAGRPGLFRLFPALADDKLAAGTNFLYLRSSNTGIAPQIDARHRLFTVDTTQDPLAFGLVDTQAATVPAGGAAITEFQTPLPAGAGSVRLILAVVDHQADRPLEPPANARTLDDLDAFCRRHPNAAYRTFRVS